MCRGCQPRAGTGCRPRRSFCSRHGNRRAWIALQALGDGDRGRITDFGAAKFETVVVAADIVFLDEQVAVVWSLMGDWALLPVAKPRPTTEEMIVAARSEVNLFM